MDYLITGATGFIGSKLVARLLSGGHTVNYLARKRSARLDSRAAFHRWTPHEIPPLKTVPSFNAVVHLAGEPIAQRWSAEVKQRIRSSRVDGTRKLVSTMADLRRKPEVLISASAVGYYGDRGDELLPESSGPGTGFLAELCVDWEREALRARDLGIRVVLVRIAVVLGREGGALPQMLTPFRLGIGGRFGSGRQWMPWIHVDDLVRLFLFSAETSSALGPLNGASPQPVTNAEFTKTLATVLHRPALIPVPKLALKIALGELADFLLDSERVVPKATQKAGFQFEYPALQSALQSLLQ
jgi:uncharacterized protein (TIGR01777 family)